MPIDPCTVLNAMLRAEAFRSAPAAQPPPQSDGADKQKSGEQPEEEPDRPAAQA